MLLGGCGKEPDAEETLAQGENVVDETAQNDVNDNAGRHELHRDIFFHFRIINI